MAISNVHFLVTAQILKGILPHGVPAYLKTDMEIALYSFSQFDTNPFSQYIRFAKSKGIPAAQ